jgi:hypothetical protein
VADLARERRARDHADDATTGVHARIGLRAHQADAPAAVDERETPPREYAPERHRRVAELAPVAFT